jgi:GMP synthase (glutamine-hydrolysing)
MIKSNILIINVCKEKLHYYEFVRPLEDIIKNNNQKFFTKNYKKISKKDLKKAKKIIICGTSLKDFEFYSEFKKFNWIKNFEKPILGICAGAQIIAKVFGSKISNSENIGLKKIKIIKDFLKIEKELQVYNLHQKKICSLKNPLESYTSNNELFKHKTKKIYATLFHPEVRNKKIISNFIKNG